VKCGPGVTIMAETHAVGSPRAWLQGTHVSDCMDNVTRRSHNIMSIYTSTPEIASGHDVGQSVTKIPFF
jgi:hypothetical protein